MQAGDGMGQLGVGDRAVLSLWRIRWVSAGGDGRRGLTVIQTPYGRRASKGTGMLGEVDAISEDGRLYRNSNANNGRRMTSLQSH